MIEDIREQFEELKNSVQEELQHLREHAQDSITQINRTEKVLDVIFLDLEAEIKKEECSCGL